MESDEARDDVIGVNPSRNPGMWACAQGKSCPCVCVSTCKHTRKLVDEQVRRASSNDFFQPDAYLLKWKVSPGDANRLDRKYWQASCQIEPFKGWKI